MIHRRNILQLALRALCALCAAGGFVSLAGDDFSAPGVPIQILESHMRLAQRQFQSEIELREMIETALAPLAESAAVDERLAEVRLPQARDRSVDCLIRSGFPGHGIAGSAGGPNAALGPSAFALPRGAGPFAPVARVRLSGNRQSPPTVPVLGLFYFSIRNGYIPDSSAASGSSLAGSVIPTSCRVSRGNSARFEQPERIV